MLHEEVIVGELLEVVVALDDWVDLWSHDMPTTVSRIGKLMRHELVCVVGKGAFVRVLTSKGVGCVSSAFLRRPRR